MADFSQDGEPLRVLVFPCGSESGLEIHRALRFGTDVRLFGASSVDDHGRLRFTDYLGGLPRIGEPGFDRFFGDAIRSNRIRIVFSTHDSVSEYLARRAEALGFFLVNPDPEANAVARRKSETYRLFADQDWIPTLHDDIERIARWPIAVKPDRGQGGQGVGRASNADEARTLAGRVEDPLLVEWLPGPEITVDCFTDRHRRLVWMGARTRERVRAGISMRSRFLDVDRRIESIAEVVNSRLRLRGPWFLQAKRDVGGEWKLLEISLRIGGSSGSHRSRGVNLPRMAIDDLLGLDVFPRVDSKVLLVDRFLETRAELDYDWDTVHVDLDGTLIEAGRARPEVVAFLFRAVAEGKRVSLFARMGEDVESELARARLGRSLFDEIRWFSEAATKSRLVEERSILVDAHAQEREEVARTRSVPVLDVTDLEFFLR
jgi:hypothetical protein